MSDEIELFYDDTPGEQRGLVARDGRFEQLLIQRENDPEAGRLGARSIGRVVAVETGLSGAFVDLGADSPPAFLPFEKSRLLRVGEGLEVEVVSEARETKGPVVRRVADGEGRPRLLAPAPDLKTALSAIAPDAEIQTGVVAIQAVWDAEEEALGQGDLFAEFGLDLAVQRTRALIAVDIDYAPLAGREARKGRATANREGLRQAARLIRLNRWGGLVAIDLVGVALDGAAVTAQAREAFAWEPGAAFGPVSRFGVLQLSLPWRRTPLEDHLGRAGTDRGLQTEAVDLARRLRHALLSDTTLPRLVARCRPQLAERAAPLVARLGPRATLRIDPSVRRGAEPIDES